MAADICTICIRSEHSVMMLSRTSYAVVCCHIQNIYLNQVWYKIFIQRKVAIIGRDVFVLNQNLVHAPC